jgi:hypothetical protein
MPRIHNVQKNRHPKHEISQNASCPKKYVNIDKEHASCEGILQSDGGTPTKKAADTFSTRTTFVRCHRSSRYRSCSLERRLRPERKLHRFRADLTKKPKNAPYLGIRSVDTATNEQNGSASAGSTCCTSRYSAE